MRRNEGADDDDSKATRRAEVQTGEPGNRQAEAGKAFAADMLSKPGMWNAGNKKNSSNKNRSMICLNENKKGSKNSW